MQKLSVYEFKDYKAFLVQWMGRAPNAGRGQRKLLAEAVGCQTPFITHVLTGDYNFSLEQAEACARWMGLSEADTEFLLLLVTKQRAGTKSLETFVAKQISALRAAHANLKQRLKIAEVMRLEDQLTYYSSWHFAAIHIACMIPQLQTVEALQKYFGLPLNQIITTLEFLTEHGFIQPTKNGYRVLKSGLHLESHSPLLPQHHTNWRLHAVDVINRRKNSDLFYSGVASISKEDFEWLREMLSQFLESAIERVKTSKEETLVGLNFDLFEL